MPLSQSYSINREFLLDRQQFWQDQGNCGKGDNDCDANKI